MGTRSSAFDYLRHVGAVMVVAGHSFALLGRDPPVLFGHQIHTLGVMLFFMVSGYLIAGSWKADPHFLRYAEKRARRVMPALIVVVFITVFALGPLVTSDPSYWAERATWTYVWRNVVLLPYHALPGVFEGHTVTSPNGSLWSLPVEVLMYVLTPVLVRLGPWTCFTAALALVIHPLTTSFGTASLVGASTVVPYFLVGAALKLWNVAPPSIELPRIPVDLSFGVYLMAFPAQQTLIQFDPDISPALLTLQTLAITGPLAWLSWTFIESPAMRAHVLVPVRA